MAKDTDFPNFPDPYKNDKSKDKMDFEVSKSPMEEGFEENKPLKGDKGPVVLP